MNQRCDFAGNAFLVAPKLINPRLVRIIARINPVHDPAYVLKGVNFEPGFGPAMKPRSDVRLAPESITFIEKSNNYKENIGQITKFMKY